MIANYNFKTKWPSGKPTLFKEQILEGNKLHTIRAERKRPTKAGDTLQLFTGLRTAKAKKFLTIPCLKVRHISIDLVDNSIMLDNTMLTFEQIEQLVRNDGFETIGSFYTFFKAEYFPDQLLNDLRLIQWVETPY